MKILYLIQSCNQERYLAEEDIIRNTWGSRLNKGCGLIFYRGDAEKDELNDDILLLKCKDGLDDTFVKTVRAFSVFKDKGGYDFIVRSNTSNWLNPGKIYDGLQMVDPDSRMLIGGGGILTNATSKGIPFLRGNLLIFSRQVLADLFEAVKTKYYSGVDDACIAMNLFKYYRKIGVDYLKTLKATDSVVIKSREDLQKINFNKTGIIRLVDLIKAEKNNSNIIKEVDDLYLKKNQIKINAPKEIETSLGKMSTKF